MRGTFSLGENGVCDDSPTANVESFCGSTGLEDLAVSDEGNRVVLFDGLPGAPEVPRMSRPLNAKELYLALTDSTHMEVALERAWGRHM